MKQITLNWIEFISELKTSQKVLILLFPFACVLWFKGPSLERSTASVDASIHHLGLAVGAVEFCNSRLALEQDLEIECRIILSKQSLR